MEKPGWLPRFPLGIQPIPARIPPQRIRPGLFPEPVRGVDILHDEGITAIIRYELLQRYAELPQIIRALRLQSFRFRSRKCAKIQRSQESKNPDDHQKLY